MGWELGGMRIGGYNPRQNNSVKACVEKNGVGSGERACSGDFTISHRSTQKRSDGESSKQLHSGPG